MTDGGWERVFQPRSYLLTMSVGREWEDLIHFDRQ
jgi:hypothetical protein